jgi:hypothetical protein
MSRILIATAALMLMVGPAFAQGNAMSNGNAMSGGSMAHNTMSTTHNAMGAAHNCTKNAMSGNAMASSNSMASGNAMASHNAMSGGAMAKSDANCDPAHQHNRSHSNNMSSPHDGMGH